MNEFFRSFRKQGFIITLQTLEEFKKNEAIESTFFRKLKDNDSYLNEFYRVKKDLIKLGLIAYKLDEEFNKVLYLTKRGLFILNKIKDLDTLLTEQEESQVEKKKKKNRKKKASQSK